MLDCRSQNVETQSSAWELCLSHVTRAYEWGEPTLGNQLARAAGDARQSCLEEGQRPETQGYRACVNNEKKGRNKKQQYCTKEKREQREKRGRKTN